MTQRKQSTLRDFVHAPDSVLLWNVLQHMFMAKRDIFYTAITRGKRLVVIVGTKKAFAKAVRDCDKDLRNSGLFHRFQQFKSE